MEEAGQQAAIDPAFIAIAGIAGTLLGAFIGALVPALLNRRAQFEHWRRENLIMVYTDALTETARIRSLANAYRDKAKRDPYSSGPDAFWAMTARLAVLAPKSVRDSWGNVNDAMVALLDCPMLDGRLNPDTEEFRVAHKGVGKALKMLQQTIRLEADKVTGADRASKQVTRRLGTRLKSVPQALARKIRRSRPSA